MTDATTATREGGIGTSFTHERFPASEHKRRRRPSGEEPPLPYELGASGRRWAWLTGGVFVSWLLIATFSLGRHFNTGDDWVLSRIVAHRSAAATDIARRLDWFSSPDAILFMRWTVILTALVFRRFRHLVAFLASLFITTAIAASIAYIFTRTRPTGVEILGDWTGFAHPSRPVMDAAVALVGALYVIIPRGQFRNWAKVVVGLLLAAVISSRLYLAVEYPTDSFYGLVLGVGITLLIFRVFVPNDAFPVVYTKRNSAHLDVGGRRGEAIEKALREQLGLDVESVVPFGLDGSAGSTPLRITLANPEGQALFGKLYAKSHLRSDRWYKLFRTLVYGRLEDESTFSSVRRLVQYEDYLLRVANEAGIPTAKPYGFVEITPQREYLLVTEFMEGAKEISSSEVNDEVIDDGLAVVRKLWKAGLAHRDIKPANVLVRDNHIILIDIAFGEVRPSPWRQAVDLANMMLVLALRNDAENVYNRAKRFFTPEEISEAFAATRGITLTSQLRAQLRKDGRNLVETFRTLAPPSPPIRIQLWSVRRVVLTISTVATAIVVAVLTVSLFSDARLL